MDADVAADGLRAATLEADAGESADDNSAASIIGATQVPEYAESDGAVAHEPLVVWSESMGSDAAGISAGGVGLAAAAGGFRTPPGESAVVGVALRGVDPGAALAAALVTALDAVPDGVLLATGLAGRTAVGLGAWPAGAVAVGGIPKPAGDLAFEASALDESAAEALPLDGSAFDGSPLAASAFKASVSAESFDGAGAGVAAGFAGAGLATFADVPAEAADDSDAGLGAPGAAACSDDP